MDTEMEALAASAATTLVGLMVTDSWQQAKEMFGRLFARRPSSAANSDLEEAQAELVALPPTSQPELADDLRNEWQARFRRLLRQDGAAASEIRGILAALQATPAVAATPGVHNTIRGNLRNSPVVQSGQTGDITMHGHHSGHAPDAARKGAATAGAGSEATPGPSALGSGAEGSR